MTDLPWYLWAIFGFGGSFYTVMWTLFSKPKEPWMKEDFMVKMGWIILSILGVYIGLDNLEKGGFIIPYKSEIDSLVKPTFSVWWILYWRGLYLRAINPNCPVDKSARLLKCLVLANVLMAILLLIVNYKWLKGFFV